MSSLLQKYRMSTVVAIVLIGLAFGGGVAAGVLGILYATGGNATESQDINEAVPTLSLDGPTPTISVPNQQATQIAQINTNLNALATQVEGNNASLIQQIASLNNGQSGNAVDTAPTVDVSEFAPTTTDTPEADSADETSSTSADVPERALYRITQDESEARFIIDEILFSSPNTVTGVTNRVAGDVIVNFSDPPASQVGQIAINARTLKTDDTFRDQSIRGQILESSQEEYEFIYFSPTEFQSLTTDPVGVGQMVNFQITGDLTIKDVTRSVTFDATVSIDSEERISGSASTTLQYDDFGLSINPPPGVEGVAEDVILQIDFVALRVEDE